MLGSNVPTLGGFPTAFLVADKWKCKCIQIYLTLSRRWDVSELTKDIIREFKKYWRESYVQEVVSHIPFLVNLASPNKELWEKSIERVATELLRAKQLGVSLAVIHLGSSGNTLRSRGVSRVIKALNRIFEKAWHFQGHLLIETMAGQGNMIGSSFQEIQHIINNVEQPKRMGICLDTAHIFESGYDLRGYDGYRKVMQSVENIIGIEKVKVIHLNDSKSGLGSHLDRHAYIGKGQIGLQMFHAVMRDQRFVDIPKIIESPQRDTQSEKGLALLRELRATKTALEEEKDKLGQLTLEEVMVWKNK